MVWYVENLKVSRADESVVKQIIEKINKIFGGLVAKVGPKHTFLGVNVKFSKEGTVSIGMNTYVDEIMKTFSEVSPVTSGATSPARRNLFNVKEGFERLSKHRSEIFHHCVAKLLYVSKRCGYDILLAISF